MQGQSLYASQHYFKGMVRIRESYILVPFLLSDGGLSTKDKISKNDLLKLVIKSYGDPVHLMARI